MLRFTIAMLFAMVAVEPALGADQALARRGWHRTTVILPAGLPRRHYDFRTTIAYGPPDAYRRPYAHRYYADETTEVLFAPVYVAVPYIAPWFGAPLLPGSSTLPGYYGSAYSYEYQGAYYGGPYVPYWDRLPYACGVYGYC
jgi:hypothetical protein